MLTSTDAKIAILGISPNSSRYSYMAAERLLEHGFKNIIGISPKKKSIFDLEVVGTLPEVNQEVHTLTVYVGKERLQDMIDDILKLKPERIILNPGTENEDLERRATEIGIKVVRGCTLVMLGSAQF